MLPPSKLPTRIFYSKTYLYPVILWQPQLIFIIQLGRLLVPFAFGIRLISSLAKPTVNCIGTANGNGLSRSGSHIGTWSLASTATVTATCRKWRHRQSQWQAALPPRSHGLCCLSLMINWLIFEFNDKRELLSAVHWVCDLAIQFPCVPVCPFHFSTSAPAADDAVSDLAQSSTSYCRPCPCPSPSPCLLLLLQLLPRLVSCEICKFFSTLDAWYKQNFCTDNDIFIVRWRACQPLGPRLGGMSYYGSMLRYASSRGWNWGCGLRLRLRILTRVRLQFLFSGRNCRRCRTNNNLWLCWRLAIDLDANLHNH